MSDAESRSSTAFFLALSGDVPASDALEFAAGVGLIRSEYVLRQAGSYVTTAAGRAALRDYAAKIAGLMDPKPVWVRTSDFEAREIATLSGCDAFEEDENPILGDRGIRRAQRYPEAFEQELSAIVDGARGCRNLGLLFSYVPDTDALDFACDAARRSGWTGPMGAMIETPSAVHQLDSFLDRRLSQIVVGTNDLTSLTLGSARGSRFTRKDHPAMLEVFASIIERARRRRCPAMLAGNFRKSELEALSALGPDGVIVHHHELPDLMPKRFESVADMHVVPAIKARTAELLAGRIH